MITITLWAEKRDAERYERETYSKVEGEWFIRFSFH
jgi:hypothetical protein